MVHGIGSCRRRAADAAECAVPQRHVEGTRMIENATELSSLRDRLEQGLVTDAEADRYVELLFERAKARAEPPAAENGRTGPSLDDLRAASLRGVDRIAHALAKRHRD